MIDLEEIAVADVFALAERFGLTVFPMGGWIDRDTRCACPMGILVIAHAEDPTPMLEKADGFHQAALNLVGAVNYGLVARGFDGITFGTPDEDSDAYLLGKGCRERALAGKRPVPTPARDLDDLPFVTTATFKDYDRAQ